MAIVKECPKNEQENIKASERLNCGKDNYGNDQYMCLPNKEKSHLVEFCKDGYMGSVDQGK